MSGCKKSVKPKPLGLDICTSDVTCFDGNLACLGVPPNSDLNDILEILANAICGFTPPPVVVDAASVTYSGTTVFGCFTLTGTNVEDVLEEIATQACTTAADLAALTLNDIDLGAPLTGCLALGGSYLATDNPITVLQALLTNACANAADIIVIYDDYTPRSTLASVMDDNDIVLTGANRSLIGLFVSISPAAYVIEGKSFSVAAAPNIPLAVSSDNYLDYDSVGATYIVTSVPFFAVAPPIAAGSIRVWMFTTNGVGVTAETDMRTYGWVNSTLLLDGSISTSKLQNLSVTGAKMETIGAAATAGDVQFFQFSYDIKGRVGGFTNKIDIGFSTALADQDILIFDFANDVWKNTPIIGTLLPAATDNQTLRYDAGASNYLASSFLLNTSTAIGIGIPIGIPLEALTLGASMNQGFQLAQPTSFTASGVGGGVLLAGTYYYVVTANDGVGTTVFSTEIFESVDGAITTAIDLAWDEQPSAAFYRVYRGTATGVYTLFRDVYGSPDVTDDGTGWTAAAAPVITNTDSYGIYLGNSIIHGDRSVHLTTDVVTFTNYSTTKPRLFNINQFADIDAGSPADIIGARINVSTLIRNTTNINYGFIIEDVLGSDINNIGGKITVSDSSVGDNVGLWINVTNIGAGDGIGAIIEAGGAVIGATSKDASALLELSSTTQGFLVMKMTAVQASAITPVDGLILYATTIDATFTSVGFWGYENAVWVKL